MASITSFKISISEDRIKRLQQKLALTDLPSEVLEPINPWSRGVPLAEIKRLASRWQHHFDWRAVEAKLNTLPQFTTDIEVEGFGKYSIHFIHQQSQVTNAIPLLFLHGWPSSFLEVTHMLPLLVDGGKDGPAFHVVAPSLIDFGFSSASKKVYFFHRHSDNADTSKEAFNVDQHAEAYHKLMLRLGYNEYVIQAGDLGYLITRFIAMRYGLKHCKAYHLNNAAPAEPTMTAYPELYTKIQATPFSDTGLAGLARTKEFSTSGNAYYLLQSSRPQTLAYSLTDSPVGLLSWIHEKLVEWSDAYPWSDDEVLTWVSIYYFSIAGPAACLNLFYENEHRVPSAFEKAKEWIDVPLGVARFEKDLVLLPKSWNGTLGPVVLESEFKRGGHFAAWERADAVVGDLRRMLGRGGKVFGCIEGRNGYNS